MKALVLNDVLASKIYLIRGNKVMLSSDLAKLYGVPVGRLNEAIKRNTERFPTDFMFQLSKDEAQNLKSQIAISSWGGVRRARPYAFTEQGVAMLSSVLKSKRAIYVNIQIMRAFVQLRQVLSTHKELAEKLGLLEQKVGKHDHEIQVVIQAIQKLIEASQEPPKAPPPKRRIGFHERS